MNAIATHKSGGPSRPASAAPPVWSPAADYVFGCGLWTLPLLFLSSMLPSDGLFTGALIFQALCLVCNNPHYAATIHRGYGSWEVAWAHRAYTIWATGGLLAVGAAAVAYPVLIPLLFTVYITWSPFHYTGQNYGIGAMFQARRGTRLDFWERLFLRYGFMGSYLAWALGAHSGFSQHPYFVSLQLNPEHLHPARAVLLASVCASLLAGLCLCVARSGWKPSLPLICISLTQACWFIIPAATELLASGGGSPAPYFSSGALAFMHCAQYLWITSFAARRDAEAKQSVWDARSYWTSLFAIGVLLFVPGPWILSRVAGLDFVAAFLLTVSLVNIHHFIIDGVIWKLRDQRVSKVLVEQGTAPLDAPVTGPISAPLKRRAALPAFAAALGALGVADLAYHAGQQWWQSDSYRPAVARWNPQDPRPLIYDARENLGAGDIPSAIDSATSALAIAPRSEAASLYVQALILSGDTTAALNFYEANRWLTAADARDAINYGVLLTQAARLNDAASHFVGVAHRNPANVEAQMMAGQALLDAGLAEDSLGFFDRALNLAVPRAGEPTAVEPERIVRLAFFSALALKQSGQDQAAEQRLGHVKALAEQLGVDLPQMDTAESSHLRRR